MKNKTLLWLTLGILLIVVVGGVVVVKSLNKPSAAPAQEEMKEDLPPVVASVVVDLKPKAEGKSVVLTVTNIHKDTESLEYELSYTTDEELPKGALGKISLDGRTEISRDILLGTCSKNVCTYDKGVKSVKLVLRFNNPSGASQYSKEYPLE